MPSTRKLFRLILRTLAIRGVGWVQGLAFTNFENSYSDTSVRRISSDSIRNFFADSSIAARLIRKDGVSHLFKLRLMGNVRVLY